MLNDLLDPARTNLKLRDEGRRGTMVEGIREETLVSVEHALQVIAAGNEQRKVVGGKAARGARGRGWGGAGRRRRGWQGGRVERVQGARRSVPVGHTAMIMFRV